MRVARIFSLFNEQQLPKVEKRPASHLPATTTKNHHHHMPHTHPESLATQSRFQGRMRKKNSRPYCVRDRESGKKRERGQHTHESIEFWKERQRDSSDEGNHAVGRSSHPHCAQLLCPPLPIATNRPTWQADTHKAPVSSSIMAASLYLFGL